jgi:hypothetical protein
MLPRTSPPDNSGMIQGREGGRSGAAKAQVCDLRLWWALQVSNLRPLPCEGSALPLS